MQGGACDCEGEGCSGYAWGCRGNAGSIAQYYISLLSGMRNIDDRDHLVGQLTKEDPSRVPALGCDTSLRFHHIYIALFFSSTTLAFAFCPNHRDMQTSCMQCNVRSECHVTTNNQCLSGWNSIPHAKMHSPEAFPPFHILEAWATTFARNY